MPDRHPSVPSRSRPVARRGAALVAAVTATLACGEPTPPRDVNLLLVSWDTLRADRLGAYGNDEWGESPSPRVDALAASGVVFETAYAPRGQTHPSIGSLLTGKYPATTGLRENAYPMPEEHTTLFEHLDAAGYQTGVFIANFEVAHPVEGWVARGADVSADGYGGERTGVTQKNEGKLQVEWDDRVERAAAAFLRGVDTSRPFALWTHYYDIHKPYNPPAGLVDRYGTSPDVSGPLEAPGPFSAPQLELFLGSITLGRKPPASDADLVRVRGLYDATVRATDDRLTRILQQLDDMGELEDTYVVFTSDHGEELYDHNRYFYHGASVYDGVVRVPLVVAGPDVLEGLRVRSLGRTIDVTPTVLDLLGLAADPEMEGVSLAPVLRGEAAETGVDHAVVEWQDLIFAVSDGRRKLIYNERHTWPRKAPYAYVDGVGFEIDCIEAYDLVADPFEQTNLLEGFDLAAIDGGRALPEEFRPLYRALRDFKADPRHSGEMDLDTLDEAARKRLAQLGYVGAGSVSDGRSDSMFADPCVTR